MTIPLRGPEQLPEFSFKVEHHDMPGLVSTIRLVPENYCLATITGIDGATRAYDRQMAERIGAALNFMRGVTKEELKSLDGQTFKAVMAFQGGLLEMQQGITADFENALVAIRARINGEFDNPALVTFGPLHADRLADVLRIADETLSDDRLGEDSRAAAPAPEIPPDIVEALQRIAAIQPMADDGYQDLQEDVAMARHVAQETLQRHGLPLPASEESKPSQALRDRS